ncbi:MAG TPA: hypothetical protein VMP68_19955 [Candidatus Eisenbacteria bacterium]|nr:hypothetical protein [Candidatus Eisenbacteria bacterium]
MDTDSNDSLTAFCESYTSQHREDWPTSEYVLAEAFVSHFSIPIVFRMSDLEKFLNQANIELIQGNSPRDLLGVNMSFGGKRKIFTSQNADHVPFRIHTLLHEIREIIEVEFRRLGFNSTNSIGMDSRADEFSFAVHMFAGMASIQDWAKDASATESTWQSFGSLCIFMVITFLFGMSSLFGAFGYRVQSSSMKRSRLKHR